MSRHEHGFTLVEVMIGTALVTGIGGVLLMSMNTAIVNTDYLAQLQVAVNAAQGQLERLAASDFDTLWTGLEFQAARTAAGQCVGIGEDTNCNGVLDVGEDLNGNNRLDDPLPGGRLSLQIRPADTRNPANPELLDLYVSACWTARQRRIGEDANCNGVLNAGEDRNGNGVLDSPVMLSTRIASR